MFKKNKKGYIQDFIFFGLVIFVISIIIIVGSKLSDDINTNYQNLSSSTEGKEISQELSDRFTNVFDWLFLTVFVLLGLAIIGSMFLLDTHPVLFFVVVVIFGFILIVMAIIGNVYDKFSTNANISSYASSLTITNWLMNSWLIALTVLGFLGIIALFAKMRMGTFR